MAPGLDWNEHSGSKEIDEKKSIRSGRLSEGRTMGSRRIFAPQFKLQVLDSYRKDADCRGNQRATARKYGIHRRQIQKWLQVEASLRTAVEVSPAGVPELTALNLCADAARQRDDGTGESRQATCQEKRNRPTRVTLFPRIKVEPQSEQKGVTVSLFPSVRVDVAKSVNGERVKEEDISEEDDMDVHNSETEQALDFTCATLSKRRSFSLQFKLEVLDAFYSDRSCRGNQRATARKFGINRRQVQKWLGQELELRGEAAFRGGLYRQRLGRWLDSEDGKQAEENDRPAKTKVDCAEDHCWDLSNKKRKSEPENDVPSFKKRIIGTDTVQYKEHLHYNSMPCIDKLQPVVQSGVQETALCLVKVDQKKEPVEEKLELNPPVVTDVVDDTNVGLVLLHANKGHVTTPTYILSPPPVPYAETPGLQHMLHLYHGLVAECKIHNHTCPLTASDCYHGNCDCHGHHHSLMSKFGVHRSEIEKWLKQDDQLYERDAGSHTLCMFR